VTLTLLTGYSLELVHIRGNQWRTNESKVIDDRFVIARLIVLDKHLNVLHILELNVPQIDRSTFQVLGLQLQLLHRLIRLGHVKVQRPWLVDEQLNGFGAVLFGRLQLDGMDFDGLIEGQRQNQLFVTVRGQVATGAGQGVRHRMVVRLVQAFTLIFHDERAQVHQTETEILAGLFATRSIVLLDFGLESIDVGALHSVDLFPVSEENECGHGRHSLAHCSFLALVHVHFEKNGVRVFSRHLVEQGRNVPARPAPENAAKFCMQSNEVGHYVRLSLENYHFAVKSTTTSLMPAELSSVWKWLSSLIAITDMFSLKFRRIITEGE
jgi:hypothetical protein